ncbi:MAG TPA: hypothetical protein VFM90_00020, partial [Cyclobacteriaceae bacterium]|nr:hypothetical protein [Cyclobacteriaceae bacterium]
EEKRMAALEREKEKRKNHYHNKVKVKQPKRPKPIKEVTAAKKPADTRPVPKTWVGKFLRWWTT